MASVIVLRITDVKDRLLKANHNYKGAGYPKQKDVKDRLLKANHNTGFASEN